MTTKYRSYSLIFLFLSIVASLVFEFSIPGKNPYRAMAVLQVDFDNKTYLKRFIELTGRDQRSDIADFVPQPDVVKTIAVTLNNTELMRQVIMDNDLINNTEFAGANSSSSSIDRLARDLSRMTRAEVYRNTRLIRVYVEHPNPDLAQDLVNWVAQGYIKQHANRKLNANRVAADVLTQESERLKLKLRNAEIALLDFRRTSKMVVSLEERHRIIENRLDSFHQTKDENALEMTRLETDLNVIQSLGSPPPIDKIRQLNTISSDPELQRLEKRQAEQKWLVDRLSASGNNNPEVAALEQAVLDKLNEQIAEHLTATPDRLKVQIAQRQAENERLLVEIQVQENESLKLSAKAVEYNVLEREVETTKQLYESVMSRIKEIDVTSGLQDEIITLVQQAEQSGDHTPSTPLRVTRALGFGLVFGILIPLIPRHSIRVFDYLFKVTVDSPQNSNKAS